MIDQTVWLAPKATSYVVVCEECAAEHGYLGAQVEGRLELERGHTAVDVRTRPRDPRRAREPRAYRRARRVVERAQSRRACHRHRRCAVGRRGQGQDRRPARAGLGRRLPLPGRPERGPHRHRRRRDVQVPPPAVGDPLRQGERARRRLRRRSRRCCSTRSTTSSGRGISAEPLKISGNAHLIMPWHIAIDGASEKRLGKLQIGTTRRGIGPAYADKAARLGIRVQDLLDPKILRQKIEVALAEKNVWLERVYEHEPFELDEVASRYEGFAQRLRPFVADTSLLVDRALAGRQARAARGRAGDAPRPRPRHVSVRHLVEPDRRRGGDGDRDRADADRRGDRRLEGVRDARRRGPVPERDGRGARRAGARARPGVRHGHRPRAAAGLARPRRAPLRRAPERDHVARPDEARRALDVRRAAGLRRATASRTGRRRPTSRRTRATSTTPSPCSRRCRAGREPLDDCATARRPARGGARLRRARRAGARRARRARRHRRRARAGARARPRPR